MRWVRYVAIAIVNVFGVVICIIWVAIPTTFAQPTLNYKLALSPRQPDGDTPQSLPELYKLLDRLSDDYFRLLIFDFLTVILWFLFVIALQGSAIWTQYDAMIRPQSQMAQCFAVRSLLIG